MRNFVGWHSAKTRLLLYTLQTNGFEFSLSYFSSSLYFVILKLPLIEFFSDFTRIFPLLLSITIQRRSLFLSSHTFPRWRSTGWCCCFCCCCCHLQRSSYTHISSTCVILTFGFAPFDGMQFSRCYCCYCFILVLMRCALCQAK